MTINQVKDKLTSLKPNAYRDDEVIDWISRIEGRIFAEIIQTHANDSLITFSGYDSDTDEDTELIAPEPYDEVYLFYLMMQVDLYNQELDKYNNSVALYAQAWNAFAAFWNRTYLPTQIVTNFGL